MYVVILSWTSIKVWHRREKLLNKVILFSLHTKSILHRFIQLQLKHWCHMDYFNDGLTTFLGLEHFSCVAVYGGPESLGFNHLNLCSEDEWRSYGFGKARGWVINDRIFIFGWTITLKSHNLLKWPLQPHFPAVYNKRLPRLWSIF